MALARLAHEQEHDQALIERDEAIRQRDENLRQISDVLCAIRSTVTPRYGPDAWPAIAAEVRELRPMTV